MPQPEMYTVPAVLFAIAVILLMARLAVSPMQTMVKLMTNSLLAVVLLCLVSLLGQRWQVHLPINPVTVLLIAVLGLPGLLLVSVLYLLLV